MSDNGLVQNPEGVQALSGRPDFIQVTLGSETYHVTDQPVTRVLRQLKQIPALGEAVFGTEGDELDFEGTILRMGDAVYEVVHTFIPNVMGKHRFHGFATKEEFEADSYDPDSDAAKNAPTLRQLIDVFEAAYEMNDLARLQKMVGKAAHRAMGPELTGLLQGWIVSFISTQLEQSRTSLSTSGDSQSESSTTTPETSEAPTGLHPTVEDSPSPVSTAS